MELGTSLVFLAQLVLRTVPTYCFHLSSCCPRSMGPFFPAWSPTFESKRMLLDILEPYAVCDVMYTFFFASYMLSCLTRLLLYGASHVNLGFHAYIQHITPVCAEVLSLWQKFSSRRCRRRRCRRHRCSFFIVVSSMLTQETNRFFSCSCSCCYRNLCHEHQTLDYHFCDS